MAIASPDMWGNVEGGVSVNNPKVPENMVQPIVKATRRDLSNLRKNFYPVEVVNGRVELMPLEYVWEHPGIGHIWRWRDGVLVYQDESGKLKVLLLSMSPEEKMKFWEQVEKDKDLEELVYWEWWYFEVMPSYLWNELLSIKDIFESLTWKKLPDTVFDDIIVWVGRAKVWKSIEKEPTKVEIDLLKLPYPFQQQLMELLQKIDNSDLDEETKKLSKAVAFVAALTIIDPSRETTLSTLYDEQTAKEISFRSKALQKIQQSDLSENIKQVLIEFLSQPQHLLKIDNDLYKNLIKLASTHYNDEIWAIAALIIASSPQYSEQALEEIKNTLEKTLPQKVITKIYNNEDLTSQEFITAIEAIFDQHPEILPMVYIIVTNQPATAEQVSSDKLLEFVTSLLGFGKDPQREFPSYLENLIRSGAGDNPSLVANFALIVLDALEQNKDKVEQEAQKYKQGLQESKQKLLNQAAETYKEALGLLFNELQLPDQFRIDVLTQTNKEEAINLLLEAFHQKYPFLDIKALYNSGELQGVIELLFYQTEAPIYKQLKEKYPGITFKEAGDFLMANLIKAIQQYSTKELSPTEIEEIRIKLLDLTDLLWGIELNKSPLFYRIAKSIIDNPEKFDPKVVEVAKKFLENYDKEAYSPSILNIALRVLKNPSNDHNAKKMALNVVYKVVRA